MSFCPDPIQDQNQELLDKSLPLLFKLPIVLPTVDKVEKNEVDDALMMATVPEPKEFTTGSASNHSISTKVQSTIAATSGAEDHDVGSSETS